MEKITSRIKFSYLWDHQKKALQKALRHFKKNTTPFLIRLPTGTGKTGIIAAFSFEGVSGSVLIITPWAKLRNQMKTELEKGFWIKARFDKPKGNIFELFPKNISDLLPALTESNSDEGSSNFTSKSKTIYICTFNSLASIKRDYPKHYHNLANAIDYVIVDECHYEPALKWGRAVKALKKPTLLLTATPYRNDLKLFRIENINSQVFQLTHTKAESEGVIRAVDFVDIVSSNSSNIVDLCVEFIQIWNNDLASRYKGIENFKAIICCSNSKDIEIVVNYFNENNINAIGIHENFSHTKNDLLYKNVPEDWNKAVVWVHQNKLTEGIDHPGFCCVAFFYEPTSDRKLIQQIGRVLRKNGDYSNVNKAVIISPSHFNLKKRWSAYREYEENANIISQAHYRKFIKTMLDLQPNAEYFNGRFRKKFDISILDTDPQVYISPSILIRKIGPNFCLEDYIEDCTDSLNLTDALILGKDNEPCQKSSDHALWVYVSIANSKILSDRSLYEIKLETHCAVINGNYLIIADTTGTYPIELLENSTCTIGPALSGLIDNKYRITNVSVASSIPFDTVIRSSNHQLHDLNRVPTSLTDRIQVCRAVRGISRDNRRYLGLQNGRVREELSSKQLQHFSLEKFIEWASLITQSLSEKSNNQSLKRYMQHTIPPLSPIPSVLSIDFSSLIIKSVKEESYNYTPVSSSVSIIPKEGENTSNHTVKFTFMSKEQEDCIIDLEMTLKYQEEKNRFWFGTKGDKKLYIENGGNIITTPKGLSEYLNMNQHLVLIGLDDGVTVYQDKTFYQIDYNFIEESILQYMVREANLECYSEKGSKNELEKDKKRELTEFLDNTLFKLIAKEKINISFTPEVIICDDLGAECADFIFVNFENKSLAFIHAKVGDASTISASAFHEITSQAMKNLTYISRSVEMPSGVGQWARTSKWNNTKIPRIYKSSGIKEEGSELWNKIRREIITSADAKVMIVLVTSGCCNIELLEKVVKKDEKREPQVAQLFFLIDGLIGYARQLGASVKIIDIPYNERLKPPAKSS
ncbi:DEAD/DEAH box helicase [Kosakonia cowanii]|uniref:DEAD/DEAH box helicase n=1 Tax=Kosakonia cowanii TaxID=208223 RepID=UPI000FECAD97|nr:DEAD/DEAH box helicase family protein [Kosakonia cowanii]QAR45031.1 DEAD/DEAH box helicase [Kosakonia cowanii]